MAFTGMIALS